MSPDSKRGPRADAARNAARLVAAAREVVPEAGNDVAFDVIARRAGIGNATLYRHFPTHADLLVAVYAHAVSSMACIDQLGGRPPGSTRTAGASFRPHRHRRVDVGQRRRRHH